MWRDLTHSVRRLAAHPGIAVPSSLLRTMFSVIHSSLLRPLPYPESGRRVMIQTTSLDSPDKGNRDGATTADFIDWRRQSASLVNMHMFTYPNGSTARGFGRPERIVDQAVTPGLLESLGARPVMG